MRKCRSYSPRSGRRVSVRSCGESGMSSWCGCSPGKKPGPAGHLGGGDGTPSRVTALIPAMNSKHVLLHQLADLAVGTLEKGKPDLDLRLAEHRYVFWLDGDLHPRGASALG